MFKTIRVMAGYRLPYVFSQFNSSFCFSTTVPHNPISNGQNHLNQIYQIKGWSAQYILNAELIVDRYISKGRYQLAIMIRYEYEKRLIQQFGENSQQYNEFLYDDVTRWSLLGRDMKVQQSYEKILGLVERYPELRQKVKQNHNLEFIAAKFMVTRGLFIEALSLMNRFKERFVNFEVNQELSDVIRFGFYMEYVSIAERLGNGQQIGKNFEQMMKLIKNRKVKQVTKRSQINGIILYAKWLKDKRQSLKVLRQLEGCLNRKNNQHMKVIGLLNCSQSQEKSVQGLISEIQQLLKNQKVGDSK